MKGKEFCELAGRLMRRPTVPCHESAVREEVEAICAEHQLPFARDRFGNVLVRLQSASRGRRPLVLAAHLDHPGFEIVRPIGPNRWLARFRGGVPPNYFRRGSRLRLMPGALPAVLGKPAGADRQFEVHSGQYVDVGTARDGSRGRSPHPAPGIRPDASAPAQPAFAVWELEDFAVQQGRIRGRACDDLIGVAAILATLIELKRTAARVNVIGVISRAEEIGFLGALTVAAAPKPLPKNALIVSLETSREIPPVRMGQGVIIRVGDRTSIFDSAATRFLAEVAQLAAEREPSFRFQRALMSGGTCEATAYQEFGFQTAALCIALGNYHNCAPRRKIAAEFVSVADACGMVHLLVETALQIPAYQTLVGKLPRRLKELLKTARQLADGSAVP